MRILALQTTTHKKRGATHPAAPFKQEVTITGLYFTSFDNLLLFYFLRKE